jgi:hypothetical protein
MDDAATPTKGTADDSATKETSQRRKNKSIAPVSMSHQTETDLPAELLPFMADADAASAHDLAPAPLSVAADLSRVAAPASTPTSALSPFPLAAVRRRTTVAGVAQAAAAAAAANRSARAVTAAAVSKRLAGGEPAGETADAAASAAPEAEAVSLPANEATPLATGAATVVAESVVPMDSAPSGSVHLLPFPQTAEGHAFADRLRSLLEDQSSTVADMASAIASASPTDWSTWALENAVKFYTQRVSDADAAWQLYEHVIGQLGCPQSSRFVVTLVRCLLNDWKPEHTMQRLQVVRARQLARRVHRRAQVNLTKDLISAGMLARPETAALLQQWAEEDGGTNMRVIQAAKERRQKKQIQQESQSQSQPPSPPPSKKARQRSKSADPSPRQAAVSSSPRSGGLMAVLHALRQRRPAPSPAIVEEAVAPFSRESWTVPALQCYHAIYHHPDAGAQGAFAHALKRFNQLTTMSECGDDTPSPLVPEPQTYVNLMCVLAVDSTQTRWKEHMEALRERMRAAPGDAVVAAAGSSSPPRFNTGQLCRLRSCFVMQKPQALPILDAWAAEDGVVWPAASNALVRRTLKKDTAKGTVAMAQSATAASPVAPSSAASDSASLEARLLQLLERSRAPSSVVIEVAVARFPPEAWNPAALHNYLRLYGVTRGAVHALRAFALVHGEDALQQQQHEPLRPPQKEHCVGSLPPPDVESIVGLLCCFGPDWNDGHLARMDALRSGMRARGLAFNVADMLRLHAHLRGAQKQKQAAATAGPLARVRRWAMEDGAFTWLPPGVKRELEAAGK